MQWRSHLCVAISSYFPIPFLSLKCVFHNISWPLSLDPEDTHWQPCPRGSCFCNRLRSWLVNFCFRGWPFNNLVSQLYAYQGAGAKDESDWAFSTEVKERDISTSGYPVMGCNGSVSLRRERPHSAEEIRKEDPLKVEIWSVFHFGTPHSLNSA